MIRAATFPRKRPPRRRRAAGRRLRPPRTWPTAWSPSRSRSWPPRWPGPMTRRCTRSWCTSAPASSPTPPATPAAPPRRRFRGNAGGRRRGSPVTRRTRPGATSRTARRSASPPRRCSAAPPRCPGCARRAAAACWPWAGAGAGPAPRSAAPPANGITCRCRFPGCESRRVDLHHILYWANGGRTDLANLVSLCPYHHTLVHDRGYLIAAPPRRRRFAFYRPDGTPLPSSPPLPEPDGSIGDSPRRGHHPGDDHPALVRRAPRPGPRHLHLPGQRQDQGRTRAAPG